MGKDGFKIWNEDLDSIERDKEKHPQAGAQKTLLTTMALKGLTVQYNMSY